MRNPTSAACGHTIKLTVDIWPHHQNTIAPMYATLKPQIAAIAGCNKAIKHMNSNDGADELKKLMKLTEKTVHNNERAHASPRVHTVQPLNSNKPITVIMVKDIITVIGLLQIDPS